MREISLKELNEIRIEGYRPGVVCCLVNAAQLLLVFKKEYGLWLIPQGGVDNKETIADAIERELVSELGQSIFDQCKKEYNYFGEGDIEFNPNSKGMRELQTDEGNYIDMKGKRYFFFVVECTDQKNDLSNSEFDDYAWVNFEQAEFLLGKNYQLNKKELTLNAINQLKNIGVLK